MKDFIKVCENIKREIEKASIMIIDNPDVNELFIETYGADAEDNPVEYTIKYILDFAIFKNQGFAFCCFDKCNHGNVCWNCLRCTYSVWDCVKSKFFNFLNLFNSLFGTYPEEMYICFYNFNFPDHIEYDDVLYAKFQYDVVSYQETTTSNIVNGTNKTSNEIGREKVISEYNQSSNVLQVNKNSVQLEFPTFYLGNRIKDKQFGSLDLNSYDSSFDYDCSVLLGSTYRTCQLKMPYPAYKCVDSYDKLDEIEILELHYENDGIVYKCQMAGGKVDTEKPNDDYEPINPGKDDESLWDKMVEAIKKFFSTTVKDFYKKNKN